MTRINSKIGDVFSVEIDSSTKKYFQYIITDATQLNSDVIRAFKKRYTINEYPDLFDIVNDEVEFYAHCIIKLGLKMGYWTCVGNIADIGSTSHLLFRNTDDYGSKPGEQVNVSNNWYVWYVNDRSFKHVGKLLGENKKAEIGIVVSPDCIVNRIKTGKYGIVYPDFE